MNITSRENLIRVINFNYPERIGLRLLNGNQTDIADISGFSYHHNKYNDTPWGSDPSILSRVPNFHGQVRTDMFGNIWGRLDSLTKGECIKGVIEDDWSLLDDYTLPNIDFSNRENIIKQCQTDLYRLAYLPGMPFAIMRCMRNMENLLMDIILEPENVKKLSDMIVEFMLKIIDGYIGTGIDGVFVAEDWGTQNALLISPTAWREIFKPGFKAVSEKLHKNNMHFFVHSCGYIKDIIEDLIEINVDVLQLDQPELMGVNELSEKFSGRVTFWCPVDIQKIMPSADKNLIEEQAQLMISCFGGNGGGFIGADYPDWAAIDIEQSWADYARNVFLNEGYYPVD